MSKPTMQDLAEALGVSRITVWKALTNRPGVSDKLRRQVQATAAQMGYAQSERTVLSAQSRRTFSVVVSRPESSAFWMQIIHHIAKELAQHGINLMYTYMPTADRPGFALPASLSQDAVDGFIVLNIYDLGLHSHYEEISAFLQGMPALPDAFVCPSDFIAHYIQRYLTDQGVPPERAPILTGFDNNTEYANVAGQITTVDVDTAALGRRMARQLIYRADFPDAPRETTYFTNRILYRGALEG